jgi:hypothetical protein
MNHVILLFPIGLEQDDRILGSHWDDLKILRMTPKNPVILSSCRHSGHDDKTISCHSDCQRNMAE